MADKLNMSKEAIEQENYLKKVGKKNKKKDQSKDQSNVLGILSIVFGVIGLFALSLLFGIVGLVCGIKGLGRENNTTVSTIGIVFSIISLGKALLIFFGLMSVASLF